MAKSYYIGNGTIEYLNPGVKCPIQNVADNGISSNGNYLKPGRPGKRTRANFRIPVLACDTVAYIDRSTKGFKPVRLTWGLGIWIVSD